MSLVAITGASSGIGKGYAEALAKGGHDLVLIARRTALLSELKTKLEAAHHVKVTIIVADLSMQDNVELLAKQLGDLPIDILINNAGANFGGDFFAQDSKRILDLMFLLMNSLTYLTHAVGLQMAKRGGGKIVNIASIVSFWPSTPTYALYGAAKRYVTALSESIDRENTSAQNKVRVIVVNPGWIGTEFGARSSGDTSDKPEPSSKATPTAEFVDHTLPHILNGNKRIINYGKFSREWSIRNATWMSKASLMRYFAKQNRRFGD